MRSQDFKYVCGKVWESECSITWFLCSYAMIKWNLHYLEWSEWTNVIVPKEVSPWISYFQNHYTFLFTSFVIFRWFISSAMEMLKIERRTKLSCMTSAAWNVRDCPLLSKKADCAVFEESGNEDTWSQFLVIYFGSPDLPVLWSFIASDFPH